MEATMVQGEAPATSRAVSAAAALGALGIVYGDIGTSPLYALRETIKAAAADGPPQREAVLGSVSLILWSLVVIVALKYAILILRADNRGEGGIVAMLALLGERHAPARSRGGLLLVVGMIGAALLYGDGAITPAISVLSAVEGLKLDAPSVVHQPRDGGGLGETSRHGGLARGGLRADAAQCRGDGELPVRTGPAGDGGRHRDGGVSGGRSTKA